MTEAAPSLAHEPWFADVIGRAHLRHGGRVLQLTATNPAQTRAILARIGPEGSVTVVEPDRYRAAVVDTIEHAGLTVLAYQPDGHETFGVHDAVIASPPVIANWPLNRWGDLALRNLRPGGRLVLDLPAERHCDIVAEAWREIGGPPDRFGAWNGPNEIGLAKLLRADGLREVEPHVSTHLVRFDNPLELAQRVGVLLGATEEVVAGLQLALARRLATNEAVELLFRRARVTAMR